MNNSFISRLCTAIFCLVLIAGTIAASFATVPKILVISVAKGFVHGSIPTGEKIIGELALAKDANTGYPSRIWDVDYARTDKELMAKTTPEALKNYSVIVFNNTTGDLPLADRDAFMAWVKNGGGVVGFHAATDTFHNWPEFIDMIGGEFLTHGPQSEVEFIVEDPTHPATKKLPRTFKHIEEVYILKNFSRANVRVLISIDKNPSTREPGDYPVAWCRDYGKGRVFYTSIGHREDLMNLSYFKDQLLGGIMWAAGEAKGSAKPVALLGLSDKAEGFKPLFDGKDTKGWHPREEGKTQWTVKNGVLTNGKGGADLITKEKFNDFILKYEYRVPKGGNSGVFLRGRYEIQVLDDYDNKKPDIHGNGAIYGLITPSKAAGRPAGEWQTVQATLTGKRVSVVLNGVPIITEQEITGPTGSALDANVDQPGPIMLQGDHGPIEYRNIRIKRIK